MAKFKVGDKVRILDGSKIEKYVGGWIDEMKMYVGDIDIIEYSFDHNGKTVYRLEHHAYSWDERGLDLVCEEITITRHGNKVVAKYGKKVGVAKCNPDDEFDFAIGAKLAFDRLMGFVKPTLDTTNAFDWDGFKARKFFVKCTMDNYDSFIAEAKKHGCTFKSEEFNPFTDKTRGMIATMAMLSGIKIVDKNETLIDFEKGNLKVSVAFIPGMDVVTW